MQVLGILAAPAEVAACQVRFIISSTGIETCLCHPEQTFILHLNTQLAEPGWCAVTSLFLTEWPVLEGGKSVPNLQANGRFIGFKLVRELR